MTSWKYYFDIYHNYIKIWCQNDDSLCHNISNNISNQYQSYFQIGAYQLYLIVHLIPFEILGPLGSCQTIRSISNYFDDYSKSLHVIPYLSYMVWTQHFIRPELYFIDIKIEAMYMYVYSFPLLSEKKIPWNYRAEHTYILIFYMVVETTPVYIFFCLSNTLRWYWCMDMKSTHIV